MTDWQTDGHKKDKKHVHMILKKSHRHDYYFFSTVTILQEDNVIKSVDGQTDEMTDRQTVPFCSGLLTNYVHAHT